LRAVLARRPADGFDAFDAEGFDDGLDGHRATGGESSRDSLTFYAMGRRAGRV
jgi:hypothetical protein